MAAHAPFGVAVDVAILLCCGILLLRSRQSSAGAARRGPPLPVPAAVAHDWAELATPRAVRVDVFEPGRLGTFPAPVRRWLEHAIAPGTPLVPRVELTTHGEIKIGPWMYYDARQILAPPAGMVWTAVTGLGPLNIRGFDRYTRHQGELNWRIFGAIPFLRARGEKVDRSAAGRLAAEALLNPASALAPWVSWQAIDDAHATARMTIDGAVHSVTIEVDPGGRLLGCTLPRSGGPGKDPDRVSAFHVAFDGEVAFNEFTIPATLTAGWDWSGSRWANGSFFRATITQARFY